MKLKLAIDFSVPNQRERVAEIVLTNAQAKAIVTDYFNAMDYGERQKWLMKQKVKATKVNLI